MTRTELRAIGSEWQAITQRLVQRLHAVPGQLAERLLEVEQRQRQR